MVFEEWLCKVYKMKNNKALSYRSVTKYISALKKVSDEMIQLGIINKDLENMSLVELENSSSIIFSEKLFLIKDNKGNKMYSNAVKRFIEYKKYLNL